MAGFFDPLAQNDTVQILHKIHIKTIMELKAMREHSSEIVSHFTPCDAANVIFQACKQTWDTLMEGVNPNLYYAAQGAFLLKIPQLAERRVA